MSRPLTPILHSVTWMSGAWDDQSHSENGTITLPEDTGLDGKCLPKLFCACTICTPIQIHFGTTSLLNLQTTTTGTLLHTGEPLKMPNLNFTCSHNGLERASRWNEHRAALMVMVSVQSCVYWQFFL